MKDKKGITLIALIITIIVMMILVAVTVSIVINSGLIDTAKRSATSYKTAKENEENMNSSITIGDMEFESPQAYVDWLMGESSEEDTLIVTAQEYATESRASVVVATVESDTVPTEEELQAQEQINPTNVQNMFLLALKKIGMVRPNVSWNDIPGVTDSTTITDIYNQMGLSGHPKGYTSSYNMIVREETYNIATFVCGNQTITGTEARFAFTKNGMDYTIMASKINNQGEIETGRTSGTTALCEVEEFSPIQNSKQTLEIDGYTVTIPAGFAYGTSTNVGHVTTGFVITDSVEQVGENTYYSNGNEFVWIPVNSDLKVGTPSTDKVMAKLSTGSYAGSTDTGTANELPNYEGVLYDFSGSGNSTTSSEKSSYGQNTTNYREPAYLNDNTYADASPYNTIGISQTGLQREYNKMIASVKANGGFYVGRYEMGQGNSFSKLGVTVASASDGIINLNTEEGALRWYGLYDKANDYTNSTVASQMIWGSQYDAILNFALEDSNSKSNIQDGSIGNKSGDFLKTGTHIGTDKILNIYDLGGNLCEWTVEAGSNSGRNGRGGSCGAMSGACMSYRGGWSANSTSQYLCSRISLYIK